MSDIAACNAPGAREGQGAPNEGSREHMLLTVLGRNPRPACYSLGDRQAEARLAPLALLEMLPDTERPDQILAICTDEARQDSLPILKEALAGRTAVEEIPVQGGEAQEDVGRFLTDVVARIPQGAHVDLTVDVTHGFRHFSFLTWMAVLYLAALRGVRVRGAYYGLLSPDRISPFLDLRPLLELPRWIHAIQVLSETGSSIPMARLLDTGSPSQVTRKLSGALSQISEGYLSGLPLELGRQIRLFHDDGLKPLKRLLKQEHDLPLAEELVENLRHSLAPFVLDQQVSGEGWKSQVTLSEMELARQAHLIDDLLKRENTASALGLLNEWTVSWVALRLGEQENWLDYTKGRRKAAHLLGALKAAGRDDDLRPFLSDDQRQLGEFWDTLCDLRNSFHHHGMRPQSLIGNQQTHQKLDRVRAYWKDSLRACPDFSMRFTQPDAERVLVSPIGNRPGVLFSALKAFQSEYGDPTMCLVLCSDRSEAGIAQALERAGYAGRLERLQFQDPYGGRDEIQPLVRRARLHLLGAQAVLVNLTGGTTLMGLAAEAVAGAARNLACPVRRFGLVDRRSPEEQAADPFQMGEPLWLDNQEDADAQD